MVPARGRGVQDPGILARTAARCPINGIADRSEGGCRPKKLSLRLDLCCAVASHVWNAAELCVLSTSFDVCVHEWMFICGCHRG